MFIYETTRAMAYMLEMPLINQRYRTLAKVRTYKLVRVQRQYMPGRSNNYHSTCKSKCASCHAISDCGGTNFLKGYY